jgi:hypothetical protein
MNVEMLRQCAVHLEDALLSHKGASEDVDFLLGLPGLTQDLSDAKNGKIVTPRDPSLGLGVWMLESGINNFEDISNLLAEFRILLRGWDLPGRPSWEH